MRTHENLPALNCVQYKADKKIVDEQDVVQSNKLGFGSHIGAITNRITSMTSLMANYERGSAEYEVLKYRTQCGQAQQQAEIDKAKGITSNPMPKSWYIYSENKIDYNKDSPQEIERKQLYQKVCANKKPYFFMYNYNQLHKKYKNYQDDINNKSQILFKQSIAGLEQKENKTDIEKNFLQWAKNKCPLDMSKSVMNRICWAIEKEFDDFYNIEQQEFCSDMIKSGYKYNFSTFKEIELLWKWYKRQVREFSKNITIPYDEQCQSLCFDDLEQLRLYFKEKCEEACPNQYELCDILIDLCYKSKNNKDIVWFVCGDTIVENLLKNNNYNLYYPERTDGDGEFWCKGFRFNMKKINVTELT